MKTFVLVCGVLAAFVVAEDPNREDLNCQNGTPLTKDDIAALNRLRPLPENNADYNAYQRCVYIKNGVMPKHDFDWSKFFDIYFQEILILHKKYPNLRRKALKQVVRGIVEGCKSQNPTGTSPGQTIVKIKNCVQGEMDEVCAQYHNDEHVTL